MEWDRGLRSKVRGRTVTPSNEVQCPSTLDEWVAYFPSTLVTLNFDAPYIEPDHEPAKYARWEYDLAIANALQLKVIDLLICEAITLLWLLVNMIW